MRRRWRTFLLVLTLVNRLAVFDKVSHLIVMMMCINIITCAGSNFRVVTMHVRRLTTLALKPKAGERCRAQSKERGEAVLEVKPNQMNNSNKSKP